MTGRSVAAAVVAGVLAGTASAAVQGDDRPATPPPATPGAQPAAAPPPRPVPPPRDSARLPDGRYDPSRVHYRVHRARIGVRVPDPGGGPDWAVKVFDAERLTIQRPARSLRGALVVGRNRCAQLGRVQEGAFGWVYGDGRFRRAGIEDRLLSCTSRRRPAADARLETVLRIDDRAAPRLAATVVWGLAPGARSVRVAGTGGADGPATTGAGAFLRVGSADARPGPGARVEAGSRTLPLGPPSTPRMGGGGLRFPSPIPGTERIEARAPDPGGGPGFGVAVVKTREGPPCVAGPGRVVEGRLGGVDLRLGVFADRAVVPLECPPLAPVRTRARSCSVRTGLGTGDDADEDAFVQAARVERRLLPGMTTVTAQCHPDVERVTLQTPRDVRTLVPSPVGHVVLAVYDGAFPGSEVVLTAHLRGGGTRTQRMPLG